MKNPMKMLVDSYENSFDQIFMKNPMQILLILPLDSYAIPIWANGGFAGIIAALLM